MLVLADNFLPHAGGSRIYYFNLYKNLISHFPEDEITVLTKKSPGWEEFDRRESKESLEIIRRFKPLPNWKYLQLPKIVFPLLEAFRLVRKRKIDLIHVGDLYPPGVIALWFKHLLKVPYLIFCHGEEITQTDQRQHQPMVRNRIYREAQLVVAASGFARSNLNRIGIEDEHIRQITPGVDCLRFIPRPPCDDLVKQFSLHKKKVLLTVARLFPRKGHDVVMKAVAKLRGEFPELRYLIVGTGPEQTRLRNLAKDLGITNVTTIVGHVTEERLPDFYNLCDIFIMPNRREADGDVEGFGIVFLEASASGKPVIGGRSGGTVDAVQHGESGFLVNPEDVDEVAATIRKLLANDELRAEMGAAGLRWARGEFSWETRAQALRQVSCEVLELARTNSNHK